MNITKRPYVTLLAITFAFAFHATSALAGNLPTSQSSGIDIAKCGKKTYLQHHSTAANGRKNYKIMGIPDKVDWIQCCLSISANKQYTSPQGGQSMDCSKTWLGVYLEFDR
ncbi:MAG: hypothetical protein ABIQ95_11805 [Bdellovibrionia bacterium]